jgi:hypothetical protein
VRAPVAGDFFVIACKSIICRRKTGLGYNAGMFFGTHLLLYSRDADADRAFLRDVLELGAVDAGEGWLILRLPPAEMGVHPGAGLADEQGTGAATLYLMCRDLNSTLEKLRSKGVSHGPVHQAGWGDVTSITLPGGGKLGIYEPHHALALEMSE